MLVLEIWICWNLGVKKHDENLEHDEKGWKAYSSDCCLLNSNVYYLNELLEFYQACLGLCTLTCSFPWEI